MKIVYAGFPKTGTKSMKAALSILGYKCMDFDDNFLLNGEKWYQIMKHGSNGLEDFGDMFKDYDAMTDTPANLYWEELLEAYPDTKIIICERDESSWFRSFDNQIKQHVKNKYMKILAMLSPTAQIFLQYNRLITRVQYGGFDSIAPWRMYTGINSELVLKTYKRHNVYVKQMAPKHRLLVLKMGDGWEPLCRFLGKPIPKEPYPHVNKSGSVFQDYAETSPTFKIMEKEAKITLSILFCVIAFIVYLLFRD